MEKNYYKALDWLLVVIKRTNNANTDDIEKIEIQKEIHKNEFTRTEFDEMYLKLKRDGYIYKYNEHKYRLTLEGYLFIQSGQYVQQRKDEISKRFNLRLMNFALILGGLTAGVYYAVELLKMIVAVSCKH